MRDQKIAIVDRITTPELIQKKDAFSYSPKLGYAWVQRLAFFALKKIGAYHWETVTKVSHVVIDKPRLIEQIYASHEAAMRLLMERPGTLYCGPDAFDELMGMTGFSSPVQIHLSVGWNTRQRATVIGMKVFVIPWMRGVLPVPDEFVSPSVLP